MDNTREWLISLFEDLDRAMSEEDAVHDGELYHKYGSHVFHIHDLIGSKLYAKGQPRCWYIHRAVDDPEVEKIEMSYNPPSGSYSRFYLDIEGRRVSSALGKEPVRLPEYATKVFAKYGIDTSNIEMRKSDDDS